MWIKKAESCQIKVSILIAIFTQTAIENLQSLGL
jgi:hypothetical protein